jgi:phage tail sheath protein FI
MAVQVTYPGVYIEEFTPGAPIEGVGTSTAAFLGTWKHGNKPNQPIKLFSWDDFLREFGNKTGDTIPDDNDYLYYAVKGFFQNGGRVCYITRVSNARPDNISIEDDAANMMPTRTAQTAIRLVALEAKANTPPIRVKIGHTNAVKTTLFQVEDAELAAEAVQGSTVIEIKDPGLAIKFRPTDTIVIGSGSLKEQVEVARVEIKKENGANKAYIRLASAIQAQRYVIATAVRLADPTTNTIVLRMMPDSNANLTNGSVIELSGSGITTPIVAVVRSFSLEIISPNIKTWRVTLQSGLNAGFSLTNAITVKSLEFKLWVSKSNGSSFPRVPTYDNLSMHPGHPRYFAGIINGDPNRLLNTEPLEIPNTTPAPFNRPKEQNNISLQYGQNENLANIGQNDYENVLATLARIDDINIVCAPGVTDEGTQKVLLEHCNTHTKDRFAVLDSRRGAPVAGSESVAVQMASIQDNGGYAAFYYPWIQINSQSDDNHRIIVPPSGHIAGVYARTDNSRGVHKAPAGTEASLNSVLGVETPLTDTEQGDLNKIGVNVVRVFQSGGTPIVWGARTTATQSDKNWQYVNVRRLFLFLEESIQEGIRWAVFEPNNLELWGKLRRTITAFLTQQWRDGALFGATAKDAFYVRIDEALNPRDQRALGRLTIEIGVKPVYPAEFIVVRIGIWQGGSEITE